MSANRKHLLTTFLILLLFIISISCYSIDQAFENWQPQPDSKQGQNANPQAVPNPDADPQPAQDNPDPSAQDAENNQSPDQASGQQPIQQPDPQPQADPEPEQTELEKCVANKDVVLVNSEVVVDELFEEGTGKLISVTCSYTTTLLSQASQPIVLLYQWNSFIKKYPSTNESLFHWRFHGPMPPGSEKVFLQDLASLHRDLKYQRLFSYVAIYDAPQCKKYVSTLEMMKYNSSVFFDCNKYIP